MSRGREWAEELSAMCAAEHGRPAPSDTAGRVVLTAEQRARGARAVLAPIVFVDMEKFNKAFRSFARAFDTPAVKRAVKELERLAKEAEG